MDEPLLLALSGTLQPDFAAKINQTNANSMRTLHSKMAGAWYQLHRGLGT